MPESYKHVILAPPEAGKTSLARELVDRLLDLRGPTARAFVHDQIRAPQYPGVCVTSLAAAASSKARRLIFREPVSADEVARFALNACGGSGRRVVVVFDEAGLRQVTRGGQWATPALQRLLLGERGADVIIGSQAPKYIPTDARLMATDLWVAHFDDEDSYDNLRRLGLPPSALAAVAAAGPHQFVHYRRVR